jgi:urease accessory protein
MNKSSRALSIALSLSLLPALAQAHPGHGTGASLLAGIAHPLVGLDHLLALLATGLLAWRMEGRTGVGIALAFPLLMVTGAVAGLAGLQFAITEVMILLSVAVLAILALRPPRHWPVTTLGVTALFALFHGHAHGLEAAGGLAGPSFVAGMALASTAVIGATMTVAQLVSGRRAARR